MNSEQLMLEANKMIFIQDYKTAMELIKRSIATDPNNIIAYIRLIQLASKIDALEEIKEMLFSNQNQENSLITWFCLTYLDMQLSSPSSESSFRQLQQMVEQDSNFFPAYYGLGLYYAAIGDINKALENHEKAINISPDWYPGYFTLSQLYYKAGDTKTGDYYFFAFEKLAPYNVYGNFNTHKNLSRELLNSGTFEQAAKAIQTLIDWWYEYKNYCPIEIEINCAFDLANIYQKANKLQLSTEYFNKGISLTDSILAKKDVSLKVMLFLAKTLEEYQLFDYTLEFYKKIVYHSDTNVDVIKTIVSNFFNSNQFDLALSFLDEAYVKYSNQKEIRFYHLLAKLKKKNIDSEVYLQLKSKVRTSISEGNFEEIFELVDKLVHMFNEDPEIHCYLGELYYRMGNFVKAGEHFKEMYILDPLFSDSIYRWAQYNFSQNNLSLADEVLEKGIQNGKFQNVEYSEFHGLKSKLQLVEKNYEQAKNSIQKAISLDQWNPEYLTFYIYILQMENGTQNDTLKDVESLKIAINNDNFSWPDFEESIFHDFDNHRFQMAYNKLKLHYCFSRRKDILHYIAVFSTSFDYQQGISDLFKLLNTELDSPMVLISLGEIHLEILRNEVAETFYEQARRLNCDSYELSVLYHGLARVYLRDKKEINKALEFAKMSYELFPAKEKAYHVLATLGYAYSLQADLETGLNLLEESIQIKENIVNKYYLASIYNKMEEVDKASRLYEEILRMTPYSLEEFKTVEEVQKILYPTKDYASKVS